jgi:hypothetical protein
VRRRAPECLSRTDRTVRRESDQRFRAIAALNERLRLNTDLASAGQLVPMRTTWVDRSPMILRIGRATVPHYDFVSQALAKGKRGHARDLSEVRAMLARGLVTGGALRSGFEEIGPPCIATPPWMRRVFSVRSSICSTHLLEVRTVGREKGVAFEPTSACGRQFPTRMEEPFCQRSEQPFSSASRHESSVSC